MLPGEQGTYFVNLYMAEIFWNTTDARIFSVFAEGQPVVVDLDLVRDIGAPFTAKIYPFGIEVSDGTLTIDFVASVDIAKVSGVEVFFQPGGVEAPFGAPIAPPLAAPVATPLAPPVTAPVAPPATAPAATPVVPPVAAPVTAPATTPVVPPATAPAATPVVPPVAAPVATPAATPVVPPVAVPVATPAAAPVVPPVTVPAATPVVPPVAPPTGLPIVARVNCGSFQFSQNDGTVWSTDTSAFHSGGTSFTDNNITVSK